MELNFCAVVPSHNHHLALPGVVAALRAHGLLVLIIDDGSAEPAASAIAALDDPAHGVEVMRLAVNGGKGAAVLAGARLARERGFTHAVQVDADGQHDPGALAALLAAAAAHPDCLISGQPRYDGSMPLGRRIGRWITHVWVFIETLSFRITDSMCGFRVYPLEPLLRLTEDEAVGLGMDFDTDVMVRLFWRGTLPVMVPVAVIYPPGNISNFRMWKDNLRISKMHTRLVLVMLARLLLGGMPASGHWAGMAERGALWGLRLVAACYRLLGRRGCMAVLAPVVLYFFLTGTAQRRASRAYLGRVWRRQPGGLGQSFAHFLDFAGRALDVLAAWSGGIAPTALESADPAGLERMAADPRGALLIVSHHGNAELARALMAPSLRQRLTILVHTRHAENYNRIVAGFNPAVAARMIQVTEIGPDTAIRLKECIERGEWVAIAGDRVPVLSAGRVARVPFLGAAAAFSQGPYILAALLGCPVHLLFCTRGAGRRWCLALEPFAERIDLPRIGRGQALAAYAAAYAARLEAQCRAAPLQWYNFFDFWAEDAV
ncbi:Acyltransferase [Candidatus Terasakiella magnetica]|nr:Acyltransferase [Candidatus Terasakiella magnetica]